jgi:hypothetical protein
MPTLTSCITRHLSKGCAVALCAFALLAQPPEPRRPSDPEPERRLPNGKLQSEEVLKADYDENLKELEKMRKLVEMVEADLRKNDRHVLSLKALKDLDEIEKLSRRIRGRMRRY